MERLVVAALALGFSKLFVQDQPSFVPQVVAGLLKSNGPFYNFQ